MESPKKLEGKFPVEYACDCNGDHTVDLAQCTESRIMEFDTELEANLFSFDCTYVYNLNEIVGIDTNVFSNPVLDCIDELYV